MLPFEQFYNVNTTWYTHTEWKQLPHSFVTIWSDRWHHDSWIPTSGIIIHFKLKTAKVRRGVPGHKVNIVT